MRRWMQYHAPRMGKRRHRGRTEYIEWPSSEVLHRPLELGVQTDMFGADDVPVVVAACGLVPPPGSRTVHDGPDVHHRCHRPGCTRNRP